MDRKLSGTVKIVQHKGVEIIISDYSGLKGRELTEGLKENTKAMVPIARAKRDCVLVSLFNDCLLDEDSAKYLVKVQKAMEGFFVAYALVGMSGVQASAIKINRALRNSSIATEFFDNDKDAMDWVADKYKTFANRT